LVEKESCNYWITILGGLILGYSFLWSDLVSYLLEILFGYIIDIIINKNPQT